MLCCGRIKHLVHHDTCPWISGSDRDLTASTGTEAVIQFCICITMDFVVLELFGAWQWLGSILQSLLQTIQWCLSCYLLWFFDPLHMESNHLLLQLMGMMPGLWKTAFHVRNGYGTELFALRLTLSIMFLINFPVNRCNFT